MMMRFKWDREVSEKAKPEEYNHSFTIRHKERGARPQSLKQLAAGSQKRRNKPVTLAGKYGVTHEP